MRHLAWPLFLAGMSVLFLALVMFDRGPGPRH